MINFFAMETSLENFAKELEFFGKASTGTYCLYLTNLVFEKELDYFMIYNGHYKCLFNTIKFLQQ